VNSCQTRKQMRKVLREISEANRLKSWTIIGIPRSVYMRLHFVRKDLLEKHGAVVRQNWLDYEITNANPNIGGAI